MRRVAGALLALCGPLAQAQSGLGDWMNRMRAADRERSFSAQVVFSQEGHTTQVALDHVCDGSQRLERLRVLDGSERTLWRDGQRILQLWPAQQRGRSDEQEGTLFPRTLAQLQDSVRGHYRLLDQGPDLVAQRPAQRIDLPAQDGWRWAHRVWLDTDSGVVLKAQTLADDVQVLEQTEVQSLQWMSAAQSADLRRSVRAQLAAPAARHLTREWRVRTTLGAEGWQLRDPLPGFALQSCHRSLAALGQPGQTAPLHCVWSDGLAGFSLFIESNPAQRAGHPSVRQGATRLLTQQRPGVRLTAVGEVPERSLQHVLQNLIPRP